MRAARQAPIPCWLESPDGREAGPQTARQEIMKTGRDAVHFRPRRDDRFRMPNPQDVAKLLPLVREYGTLEKRRTGSGITPSEFYRWSVLRTRLEGSFPQGDRPPQGERRQMLRLPTKMLVEFRNEGHLQSALIRNISRGGVFISSAMEPHIGTEFALIIKVGGGEQVELPVQVASANVPGPDGTLGIGCKFGRLGAAQQAIVDEIFATALETES